MYDLKSIEPVSFAKFYAVITALLTTIVAFPVLVLEAVAPGSGIVSYLFILAAATGGMFIAGILAAVAYNVLAGLIGGVKLNLDDHITPTK